MLVPQCAGAAMLSREPGGARVWGRHPEDDRQSDSAVMMCTKFDPRVYYIIRSSRVSYEPESIRDLLWKLISISETLVICRHQAICIGSYSIGFAPSICVTVASGYIAVSAQHRLADAIRSVVHADHSDGEAQPLGAGTCRSISAS